MFSELSTDDRAQRGLVRGDRMGAGAAAVVGSALLPPSPQACREARDLVRRMLAGEETPRSNYAAELVASELAANAVRHARSTFEVEVSVFDEMVRVAVTDATRVPSGWVGFRVAQDHGLGIVAALSCGWGVEPVDGGKVVWADVERLEF
jgi:hypothetical protein